MTNFSAMLGALSKLGADATVAEMIGATTGLEVLAAAAGIATAAYTGAVIGSLMVAASDSMACASNAQVSSLAAPSAGRNGVHISATMLAFLRRPPGHRQLPVAEGLCGPPSGRNIQTTGGTRRNWILDRIALLLTAIACALGAWAFYHYTGQWSGPIIMTIVIVENHRLRKLLTANGIESRPRRRNI